MADPAGHISIECERRMPMGVAQIAHYAFREASDSFVPGDDAYRIDMAMVPRPPNARARYLRHWQSDRYERLGAIWMVPPGEPVRFQSEAGATTCVHCDLSPESVAQWLSDESGWSASALEGTLNLNSGRIRTLLRHLADELREPGFAADAMVELICGQIVIEISRYWRGAAQGEETTGLSARRLETIDARLADEGPTPTLAELAELCALSVRHLTRAFRTSRGHSIGFAIASGRIAQAKDHLRAGHSPKVVAHLLGFASPAGFAYAFRKSTGETPREFRARLHDDHRQVVARSRQ